MPVSELKTAEGTVVEGKSNQPKQEPDGVERHFVNLVAAPESGKFEIVAFRAIGIPLDKSKPCPVVITVHAAMFAVERGAAKQALNKVAARSRVELAAAHTTGVDSSEKHLIF